MTPTALQLASLVAGLAVAAASHAQAATPVATIARLTGQVMAVKPDGRLRILSTGSRVEVGDTLASEAGSFVGLVLADGTQLVLGPQTSLKVARFGPQETVLVLAAGQVRVTAAAQQRPGHRLQLEAGANVIDAGRASFTASYIAPRDPALARRQAYLRSSLAALATAPLTDGLDDLPLRQVIAQGVFAPPTPTVPTLGAPVSRAPGLYVAVVDGQINVTNPSGAATFSSGQFGYTPGGSQPPVPVPPSTGVIFTPPPAFLPAQAGGSTANRSTGSGTVDCEVR